MSDNLQYWYKDGIVYQVHIKAFKDSNSDGMGDINGVIQKLDYIKSLGVSILWLLPFYPSPLKDDGYDIADYMDINPEYGTLEDFKKLLKEAHMRGIRVITELVLNHTSDQHIWFQKARRSKPGSPERAYYVWSDTLDKYNEARIIFSDFETSNWAWDPIAKGYFWHRFYSHQPDLNFDNPAVHKSIFKVVDFWFEMGVDGLRLDAVPYLYEREGTNCENLPETHQFLKTLNAHIQNKFKNKMLLAEANQWPEDAAAYFGDGDECHMAFHFPLMPRMYMAIQMESRFPLIDIVEQTPPIPENCQWATFLRNHDELTLEMVTDEERDYMYRFFAKDKRARVNLGIRRRLAPLVENNRKKIELLNVLLFSLPGTPVMYYGDEIGMGDNYYLGDRQGVRTPMQWSSDRNAGFSDSNPQKLFLPIIIDPEYHYEAVNVEVQQRNNSSLLWWMRGIINVRNNHKAFGRGSIEFLSPENTKVLAFIREYEDEKILVVTNLSKFSQVVQLDLSKYKDSIPIEIFSQNEFPPIGDLYYMFTLNPYDYYWFFISKQERVAPVVKRDIPELEVSKKWSEVFENDKKEFFEKKIIAKYFEQMNLTTGAKIQKLSLFDTISLIQEKIYLLIIKAEYLDKPTETYFLFAGISSRYPYEMNYDSKEIIARLTGSNNMHTMVNPIYNEEMRNELVKILLHRKTFEGENGEFRISLSKRAGTILKGSEIQSTRIVKEDNYFVTVQSDDNFIIKFYKKLEEGITPDEETLKFLHEKTKFLNMFPLSGTFKYAQLNSDITTLGIINEYIRNEGDALKYFSDAFNNYFENISVKKERDKKIIISSLFDDNFNITSFEESVARIYNEMAATLGKRTAELHLALSSSDDVPAFKAEPVSTLSQRVIYQSMRTLIKNTYRLLRSKQVSAKKYEPIVADILKYEQVLLKFVEKTLTMKTHAKKIRIHGNYNLAQILFTGKDFLITNFEGQYARPLSDRKIKRFPLRDIASLIWSLHTLAYQRLSAQNIIENRVKAETYANQWWLSTSRIILVNYLNTLASSKKENRILPAEQDKLDYFLYIYLLEKVLTDLSYGLSINADWVLIKMKGLQHLITYL
jgi:maltose alpha-D-glucosyltransferase/alpha-amylase